MTDSWAADEEFKSKGVKFDIVPPQILSMLQERGIEILPPSAGKEKEEAYKAWKAGDMLSYKNWRERGESIEETTRRIDNRIAELRKDLEQSHRPDGNFADRASKESHSPNMGAQSTAPDAKINKRIHNSKKLAVKMVDFIDHVKEDADITYKNYTDKLFSDLGLANQKQETKYVDFIVGGKDTITLRVGTHRGNARNIIIRGKKTDKGYSIVFVDDLSDKSRFKKSNLPNVVFEYVYERPGKDRLVGISKSLFNLFETGEFVNLVKADEETVSPKNMETLFSKQSDMEYLAAVEAGDMEKARQMVNEAAKEAGYIADSDYQGSLAFNGSAPSKNGYFETREERKEAFEDGSFEDTYSLGDFMEAGIDNNDLQWQLDNPIPASGRDKATLESIDNIGKVVKEGAKTI